MGSSVQTIATPEQRKLRQMELEALERAEAVEREKSKKQKNKFVQITDPHGLIAMRAVYAKSKVAGDLFQFMMQYMDRSNCLICSMNLLAEGIGKSRVTVARAIKLLEQNKYILIAKVGTTNAYHLNSSICWKAWANGKPYAKLSGTVLLSLSEQEKEVQEKVKKQLMLFNNEDE